VNQRPDRSKELSGSRYLRNQQLSRIFSTLAELSLYGLAGLLEPFTLQFLHLHTKFASPRLPLRATFSCYINEENKAEPLDLSGYCDPALIYLMAGIADNFERVKVRILCRVCRSQVRDAIEFSLDEEPQFDHGPSVMEADSAIGRRKL